MPNANTVALANAMYRLRQSGLSLSRVAAQFGCTRQYVSLLTKGRGCSRQKSHQGLEHTNPELRERILELYTQGQCNSAIARQVGVWPTMVRGMLKRMGLPANRSTKFLNEDEIRLLRQTGASWDWISGVCGRSTNGVYQFARRKGITGGAPALRRMGVKIDRVRAAQLRQEGLTYDAISKRLGCSMLGVYVALNKKR